MNYLLLFGLSLLSLKSFGLGAQPGSEPAKIVRFVGIFRGSIGAKAPILMRLAAQNGKITGKYQYISQKTDIRLAGALGERESYRAKGI